MDTRPLRGKVKADAEAVLTGIREGIGMRDLGEMNIAQRFDTEQAKIAFAKAINESEIPNEIKQGWRTLAESVRMTLAEFLNSDVTGYGGQ